MLKPGAVAGLAASILAVVFVASSLVACQLFPEIDPISSLPEPRPTAQPTAQPTVGPASVQEFRSNLRGDPPTLDPNLSSWDATAAVVSLVFEGLFKFDDKQTLAPAVATEVPTVENGGISADGKVYTIHLRDDALWSDGQPVRAGDFEFSLKRLLDPKLRSDNASSFYDISGARAYNTALGTPRAPVTRTDMALAGLRDAVGVKALDERTLRITLSDPRASFPMLLALVPASPIRQDILTASGDTWFQDPASYVGNGPFRLAEWVRRDHITLVPNASYAGPRPKLNKIVLNMVIDPQADFAAYVNGEREVVAVPPQQIQAVRNDPSLSKQLVIDSRMATFALQLNNRKPPFDDPKIRQAFSLAVDRAAFIHSAHLGIGKPAYSWIPPGVPGHAPELGKQWAFDPMRARATLAEGGYPEGKGLPPITFEYANTGNNPLYAEFFQDQFKTNLGVDVQLEPMEPAAFTRYVNEARHMIGLFGFGGDYPDPDNWLPSFFRSDGPDNKAGYFNKDVDALMSRAIVEPDVTKRTQLWAEAQQTIVGDAPIIFLYYDERYVLVKPYVVNLRVTPMDTNSVPGNRSLDGVYLLQH
ncbi:MAG: peptide ABC transporter substrate-binding protein [Chloroflexota bacterium]|nr:MAG: peptide ABC transporter substrate-binding protein [Chloroflexota bacterium]